MVSPVAPPLSYAERAKKAKNIKSAIAAPPPPQRPHHAQSNTSDATGSSGASTASPATSSTLISSSTSVDDTPNSSLVLPTRSSSPLPSSRADSAESRSPNGPAISSSGLAAKALSIVEAHTAPPKPAVNVWSLRMEKMGATGAHQKTPTTVLPIVAQPLSSSSEPKHTRPTPSTTQRTTSDTRPLELNGDQSGKGKKKSPIDHNAKDPFVAESLAQPVSLKNKVTDPENWPEVGKSLPTSTSSAGQPTAAPSFDVIVDGDKRAVNGTTATPRKSEKTKWVPIPAEELRAAADAASKSRSHSRKNSHHGQTLQPSQSNTSVHSTASNTRLHSGRTSASQSASHSRVHSRSTSVQSSPNIPRGRRLPAEESPITSKDSFMHGAQKQAAPPIQAGHSSHNANASLHYLPPPPTQIQAPSQPTPPHHSNQPSDFHASAPIFYPQNQNGLSLHQPPPISTSMYPPHVPPGPYLHHYPHYSPYEYSSAGSSYAAPYVPWGGHGHTQSPSGPAYPPPPQPHAHFLPTNGLHAPPLPMNGMSPIHVSQIPALPAVIVPSVVVNNVRVPPPETSEPVTVYKSVGGGVGEAIVPLTLSKSMSGVGDKMVFGSIDAPVTSQNPSPTPHVLSSGETEAEVSGVEKAFASFAIGVDSAEPVPARLRSRTRDGAASQGLSLPMEDHKERTPPAESRNASKPDVASPTIHALTYVHREMKWKFGTTTSTPPPVNGALLPSSEGGLHEHRPYHPTSNLQHSATMPTISVGMEPHTFLLDPRNSQSFNMPIPQSASPHLSDHASPASAAPPLPDSHTIPAAADPDFEVKDYGFGLGAARGPGYAPILAAKERQHEWEQEREKEHEIRVWQERNGLGLEGLPPGMLPPSVHVGAEESVLVLEAGVRDVEGTSPHVARDQHHIRILGDPMHGTGRGRRGGLGGGLNGRGGYAGDRGGYGGGRRGRGTNGFPRGYGGGRGGGYNNANRGSPSQRLPPFAVTPPSHLQPLPLDIPHSHPNMQHGGYYPPPRQQYLSPTGYESYALPAPPPIPTHGPSMGPRSPVMPQPPQLNPPVPVPLSTISFPLDPTRYYLLGQLEYYLSPQNLAQDFFLRQQMDERGWVPIPLIASFNRVKQLTTDVQLVRDVLTLSSILQVRGSMVRMSGWEQFVLPDAVPSTVEDQPLPYLYQHLTPYHDENELVTWESGDTSQPSAEDGAAGEGVGAKTSEVNGHGHTHRGQEDDEDEDDVVFVMGHEVGTWSPERRA